MRRRSLLIALLAACLMLFTGGNVLGAPGDPGGPREGQCEDGEDNDGDGLTDADDPACQQPGCLPSSQTPKKCAESDLDPENPEQGNCDDGEDNDGDGLIDEEDPDCQEPCPDGDGDGVCDDDDACPDVAGEGENGCPPEGPPGDETCSDGEDNDGDGLTDADDPDCQEEPGTEGPPGDPTCSDGEDNDGDGLTDANDPDCQEPTTENLCTEAAGDAGLLTDDTLGQTFWDGGADVLNPLTEDPERNGAISGPLGEAFTDTPLEVVGDEGSCALDFLLDENTFPDL